MKASLSLHWSVGLAWLCVGCGTASPPAEHAHDAPAASGSNSGAVSSSVVSASAASSASVASAAPAVSTPPAAPAAKLVDKTAATKSRSVFDGGGLSSRFGSADGVLYFVHASLEPKTERTDHVGLFRVDAKTGKSKELSVLRDEFLAMSSGSMIVSNGLISTPTKEGILSVDGASGATFTTSSAAPVDASMIVDGKGVVVSSVDHGKRSFVRADLPFKKGALSGSALGSAARVSEFDGSYAFDIAVSQNNVAWFTGEKGPAAVRHPKSGGAESRFALHVPKEASSLDAGIIGDRANIFIVDSDEAEKSLRVLRWGDADAQPVVLLETTSSYNSASGLAVHAGYLYFQLMDDASSDVRVRISDGRYELIASHTEGEEFAFVGDRLYTLGHLSGRVTEVTLPPEQ